MEKIISFKGRFIRQQKLRLPINEKLKKRAQVMRKSSTKAEVILWLQLHKKRFHGLDFTRQRVISFYIVDFYCPSLGLVIEVDGGIHESQVEYDDQRQRHLEQLGCKVFRTSNFLVEHVLSQVLSELEEFIIKEYSI
jgi:very-short-patch-repair endonuclease